MDSIYVLMQDFVVWVVLVMLVVMEVVFGIDNLIFILILMNKLLQGQCECVWCIGIGFVLVMWLGFLVMVVWIVCLIELVIIILGNELFWKDIILILGGLFLVWKVMKEIYYYVDFDDYEDIMIGVVIVIFGGVIVQIFVLDLVFLIDSIIIVVGMMLYVLIMVVVVVVVVIVMLLVVNFLVNFIEKNLIIVMLVLFFLLLIGIMLIVEGFGVYVFKGYIYVVMVFLVLVEGLNMWVCNVRKVSWVQGY